MCSVTFCSKTKVVEMWFEAAQAGKVHILKSIVNGTGDGFVQMQDESGKTALTHVVSNNHVDAVKFLLERKESGICTKNENEDTLLHTAARSNSVGALRLLLIQKKLDINAQNSQGHTALHMACLNDCPRLDVIRLFLQAKEINIDLVNNFEKTAAQLAQEKQMISVLELFRQHVQFSNSFLVDVLIQTLIFVFPFSHNVHLKR